MWRRLDAVAQKLEPLMAASFRTYLDEVRGKAPNLSAIASAVENQDPDAVMRALGQTDLGLRDTLKQELPRLSEDLQRAQNDGKPFVQFRFNEANPRIDEYLAGEELRLIREVDQETRDGIREALRQGIERGDNPRDTARTIRQGIGLTSTQQRAVANYRRLLEEAAQGDAAAAAEARGRRLRDRRFAIKPGMSRAKIDKQVARYRDRYLKFRSETIARTESLRATNFANEETWRQAAEQGTVSEQAVRRLWLVALDERTCPQCRPIPSLNPQGVRLQQPFDTPVGQLQLPPVHPNCRCAVFHRTVEGEVEAPMQDFSGRAPSLQRQQPTRHWDPESETGRWHDVAFISADDEIKQAVAAGERRLHPMQPVRPAEAQRGAYYMPVLGQIHMDGHVRGEGNLRALSTWRHEYGHHLDAAASDLRGRQVDYASAQYAADLRKDGNEVMRGAGLRLAWTRFEARNLPPEVRRRAGVSPEKTVQVPQDADVKPKKAPSGWRDQAKRITQARGSQQKWEELDKALADLGQPGLTVDTMVRAFRTNLGRELNTGEALEMVDGLKRGDPIPLLQRFRHKDPDVASSTNIGHLADFFGAATFNKVGYGHDAPYYLARGQAGHTAEAFANYVAMAGDENPFWRAVSRHFFPRFTRRADDILRELAKDGRAR